MAGDGNEREGLSLQTLVIAAVASGVAAIVVSKLWAPGTVLAAAMTPVIVTVVRELLERPMKSDTVRRAASTVSDVAIARRAVGGEAAARTESVRGRSPTATAPPPPPPAANGNGEVTPGDVVLTHPRRDYGSRPGRRLGRRPHLKVAVVTGLVAFVIAGVALTVPELIFGGSVGGGDRTTLFGGDSKSSRDERESGGGQDQEGEGQEQQQPDSSGGGTPVPGDQPEEQPSEPAEPSEPAPQQPPSGGGGTPAPSTPSVPSP